MLWSDRQGAEAQRVAEWAGMDEALGSPCNGFAVVNLARRVFSIYRLLARGVRMEKGETGFGGGELLLEITGELRFPLYRDT